MKRHGSLNRVYRLVWNEVLHLWVAVSEIGRRCTKCVSTSRVARRMTAGAVTATIALAPLATLAAPSGGKVTSGSAQINQSGSTTTIDQSSSNVSINWQSFNVGAQETVDFVQPNSSAVAVNRILSSDGSTILGHINANGQIFLINPNGVVFGAGAVVDVGGLVASTLDLTGADNGQLSFSQNGSTGGAGKVVNQGTLNAASGGYVALLGQQVLNQGVITAKLGTVALGGGSAATLTFNGNQLVHFQIDQSTLNSLAENQQLIEADGGQVIMTAGAKNSALASVVNNSGVIEARTVDDRAGVITLLAGMQAGTVNVGGTLDASAAGGGNGGAIETSAAKVKVADNTVVSTLAPTGKTGSWLIDPTDYTVAVSGGDITGVALSSELASTNVVIQSSSGATGTSGNVNIDAPVSWSSNSTLSLVASNNVNVNAPITATGATAGLVMTPGAAGSFNLSGGAFITLSGASPTLSIAGVSYTVINSLGVAGDTSGSTLQGMRAGGNYALGSNIDATSTDTWNAGAGFKSLPAIGSIEGLGHTITNLYQNSSSAEGLVAGLQGSATIRDLGLINVDIQSHGGTDVGGLLGSGLNTGNLVPTFINDYVTGTVSGRYGVGGLVGGGTVGITDSFSLANVTGEIAGGLVGSYAGQSGGASITNSYAGGTVTLNTFGQSAAGQQSVGGLVGRYAGPVAGGSWINDSYSDAVVTLGTGSTPGGGLVGESDGVSTVTNSYWDMSTSGQASSVVGTGLSGSAALQQSSYAGFNFTAPGAIWVIASGYDHPLLTSYLKPLTVTASTTTDVYNGSGQSGPLVYSDPTAQGSVHLKVVSTAVNVGTYDPATSLNFVSDQFGWNAVLVDNGNLTITPKAISVTAPAGTTKVYDGTTATVPFALSSTGVVGTDNVTFTDTSATYDTKNVGTGKTITVSGIALGGAQADDYSLINTSVSTTGAITPLAITVATTATNKIYDGSTTDSVSLGSGGVIAGDAITFSDSGANFANKNVGNGKTVTVTGITASGADASNYILNNTTATSTANVTPLTLTVSATGTNKVYDGSTTDTVTLAASGVVAGDQVSFTDTGANFGDKNVGNGKAVTVTGIAESGASAGNYVLANSTVGTTANITPATVTITATGTNRVYDGSTTDAVTLATSGVIAGDSVSATDSSANFNDKNVGNGKTVNVTGITLTGAGASNYVLASAGTATTTANITPATVTITATGTNKVYDGTTTDSVALAASGIIAGDSVSATDASATFANKNVGNGKTVDVTGITLTGADASNYMVASAGTATTTADITPKSLTIVATGSSKVYDGNTSASVMLADSGVLAGDSVSVSDTSSTFGDKNVGNGKTITIGGISLSGADAGNYAIAATGTTTANITPAMVTITATGTNKVYDGTTVDAVTLATSGVIAGDSVSATDASANFNDKNVGSGKTVNVTGITLTGSGASNYLVASAGTATTTANITPATVTITATGTNKVYDGTTTDSVALAASGIIAGDSVSATDASATFNNKNVGNGKVVSVTGITLSGVDASNYIVASAGTATTTADITPKNLMIVATGANKVYDGTTSANVTLADSGVIAGDTVSVTDTSSTFGDKNVGNGKTITIGGISLSGADAGNYSIAASGTATANITPATITVSATGSNKVYDGSTVDAVTLATAGTIAGDVVSATDSGANFANKNVGTAKPVSVTGLALTGTDAGNYVLASNVTTASANITPATVTITATGSNKVYDGSTADAVTLAANGVIAGDTVSATDASANFNDKNVGNGKVVSVTGITLSGSDASNYVVASAGSATTSANITPATITVSATGSNKVYDGTTLDVVTLATAGVIAGDVVSATDSGANFANKNVGTAKPVSVTGLALTGTDAGNYVLASNVTTASANITPATVTITATGSNKVYDGSTADFVTLAANGVIAGDTVSATDTSANFNDKNVGNGKVVNVTGITLSGSDASNYVVASSGSATASANITPATLNVVATGSNKVYDGTTTDSVTLAVSGVIAGDAVTATDGAANFADKNVGSGKTVDVTGLALSGAGAGNYILAVSTATTSADITPATLTYVATPATATQGKTLPTLTGSITGFVPGDTLTNATSGSEDWTSNGTSASSPGSYSIDGSGLAAQNYVFQQAGANGSALTIKAASASGPAPAPAPSPAPSPAPANLSSSDAANLHNTTALVEETCTTGAASALDQDNGAGCNAATTPTRSTQPALHIVNGGVRLPAQLVSSR